MTKARLNLKTDALLRYLHHHQDELIELTRDLCSFATVNPPGEQFKECTDFLADATRAMKLKTRVVKVPNAYQQKHAPPETHGLPRYNVIARWDVGAKKTLHFNSHYDVVPVASSWKTDPFKAIVKGKRLIARGTQDMKGCLAASIFAVKALQAEGLTPPWNIELSFTADEEIGGACGTGYITREGIVNPDACVICEGGWGDTIAYGHRGVLWGDVIVKGRSAHGSDPSSGLNAFEWGMKLAHEFERLHKRHQKHKTRERMNITSAERPTLTMGGVSGGGSKVNIIPGEFHFTLDRRLLAEENVEEIKREYRTLVMEFASGCDGLKSAIEFPMAFNAGYTPATHPFCKAGRESAADLHGESAQLRMFGAFTDLHFFTTHCKCPALGYGVEGAGLHGDGEYCNIDSLVKTARVYAGIALRMSDETG